MHVCTLRGLKHQFGIRLRLKAGDILCDGAGKELNVLREIADVLPEAIGRPLLQSGSIEPNLPTSRLPYSHERPRERRFPGRTRPDNTKALTGFEPEIHVHRYELGLAGWIHRDAFDRKHRHRTGQR